ncbi:hypothetical protein GF339_00075 [candidate division KSB3 bacterium]|uniref:Uncharacterized protein n=1 Tax=candidate division KSB3 bacterium TaxID=2044937 RepID=A0A9D5JRH5_9BACT|nr:hypothetical protein [candidate division KSB3 bacterium]MBD3322944.1 hypothetical protein [candidate division KSB3 bacterium]
MGSTPPNTKTPPTDISTAEAFYRVFRALSKSDRLAIARYILQDADIRQQLEISEIPNDVTVKAFAEDPAGMPVFDTIQELQKDLLS